MHARSSRAGQQAATADTSDPLAAIISLLRPQTVLSKIVSGAGSWSIRKPRYEDPAFFRRLEDPQNTGFIVNGAASPHETVGDGSAEGRVFPLALGPRRNRHDIQMSQQTAKLRLVVEVAREVWG